MALNILCACLLYTSLGGYVNLRLAPAWYGAVASAAVVPGPVAETAVPPCPAFPAALAPGDWKFLCRSAVGTVPPALAARQDGENPAWLVRYTARRMAALAGRGGGEPPPVWAPGDRELLRLTAEYPARRREPGPALGRYLAALARQLWRLEPVSGAVQRACAGVLAAGYRQLSG